MPLPPDDFLNTPSPAPEDDPILTAYALGELSADEAMAVEARLARDPAARAYVESMAAIHGSLTEELGDEDADIGLSLQQKLAIRQAIRQQTAHSRMKFPWLAIACIVIGVVLALGMAYILMTLRHK